MMEPVEAEIKHKSDSDRLQPPEMTASLTNEKQGEEFCHLQFIEIKPTEDSLQDHIKQEPEDSTCDMEYETECSDEFYANV